MNIKDSLKFGVMIGLLEVHKVVLIIMMLSHSACIHYSTKINRIEDEDMRITSLR